MDFKPIKMGKYLLMERLATGGMAEVYRAKASGAGGFEKQLAVKRILPNYSSNEEFRKMFEYEARLSSMLTHANIVQVYDFVKSGETYLLAMEYVNGKNLRQFINRAKKLDIQIPIEFGAYILDEVCKGLDYAHSKRDEITGKPLNIIHRDMSPQNVMLAYEGAIKIVDFGIAKAKDRADETRSGVIKGKFGYMSPEQAIGESVDTRTDIFSAGIILFELLTGRRLFQADSDLATLRLIQECSIPAPSRINPRITTDLERLLLTALTKDRSVRYQTAGDFHRALSEYLHRHFPRYTQQEVATLIQKVFADEIATEKKRYEQLLRQSIPFSQGSDVQSSSGDMDDVEAVLDGSHTESEVEENTGVTLTDASASIQPELSTPSVPESPAAPTFGDESSLKEPSAKRWERTELHSLGDSSAEENSTESKAQAPQSKSVPSPEITRGSSSGTLTEKGEKPEEISLATGKQSLKGFSRAEPGQISSDTNPEFKTRTTVHVPLVQPRPSDRRTSHTTSYRLPKESELNRPVAGNGRSFVILALLSMVVGWGYYSLNLSDLPADILEKRGPSETHSEDLEPLVDVDRKLTDGCALKVETDVPGVEVYLGNRLNGRTPMTLSHNCNETVTLSLRLQGYEPLTESIRLTKPYQDFYRTIKRIPTGTLVLIPDKNAEIYINGSSVGIADASKRFSRVLRAGQTYQVRLYNPTFKLGADLKATIEEGQVAEFSVRLEEGARGAGR